MLCSKPRIPKNFLYWTQDEASELAGDDDMMAAKAFLAAAAAAVAEAFAENSDSEGAVVAEEAAYAYA